MVSTTTGGKKAADTREKNNGTSRQNNGQSTHEKRVQAGKKAAETRGHASLSEAGRKGGQNSHGSTQSQSTHGNKSTTEK